MRIAIFLVLVGCGGKTPPKPAEPTSPTPDAAIATTPPDATPDAGVDGELAAAPAFVFRFTSAERAETWTLRHLAMRGAIEVVREKPGQTNDLYLGSATDDGKSIALQLTAGKDGMSLTCKRDKLDVAAANANGCKNNRKWVQPKTKKHDVLSCKHPAFEAPMPFAAAPGVEYVVVADGACKGSAYRLIAP